MFEFCVHACVEVGCHSSHPADPGRTEFGPPPDVSSTDINTILRLYGGPGDTLNARIPFSYGPFYRVCTHTYVYISTPHAVCICMGTCVYIQMNICMCCMCIHYSTTLLVCSIL